ncbi:MAG: hypothetical protein H6719_10500 [Sandaracinaceae bacterium]|nr:hypothetical protein [Sandaracinaceae bacterium]
MRLWIVLTAALLASACSSGFSSGVDGSKPFSTLTPAEAMTACESLNDYVQSTFPPAQIDQTNCYLQALESTTSPSDCQTSYEACLSSPPSGPLSFRRSDCSGVTNDPTCTARVSEVESCLTARIGDQKDQLDAIDCSIAGDPAAIRDASATLTAPPECTALVETCPSLAGIAEG